jgi:hypothetical protein
MRLCKIALLGTIVLCCVYVLIYDKVSRVHRSLGISNTKIAVRRSLRPKVKLPRFAVTHTGAGGVVNNKNQSEDQHKQAQNKMLEALKKRLFTEEVTPPTDSTCHFPHTPVVINSPSVNWIPCVNETPRFTQLREDGKSILVRCPTIFSVSTINTQWKFYDPKQKTRLYYTDMFAHRKDRMNYIKQPVEKWEKHARDDNIVPFNTSVVKVKCGKWFNFHSKYIPDPEKKTPSAPQVGKPTIVHIMTDAFPRASFFRKSQGWPNVAKLLETMWAREDTKYQSFVFNRYVSQSMNTIENLVPMYGGVPHSYYDLIEDHGLAPTLAKSESKPHVKMIWDYAGEYGYQMLMGDEMTNAPQRVMIDSPNIQLFTSHNRDVLNLFKQKTAQKEGEVRHMQCFGAEHAVEHELRETIQFLDQSPGVPKFTFLTMNQAHSKWPDGNQNDLSTHKFINALLERKEDVVLFLASDHGYGYQDQWGKNPHKYPGGEYERLLPMLGIVVPNTVLAKLGKTYLFTNQQRLVTCFDINLTFEALMAGYKEMVKNSSLQSRAIPERPGATALNLITQEIPKNRTCDQAGITESACVCAKWRDLAPTQYQNPGSNVMLVMHEALDFINRERLMPNGSCRLLFKNTSTVLNAAAKAPVKVGYNTERAATANIEVNRVRFTSTWSTTWRVVASVHLGTKHVKLLEVIPLHRFNKRKVCWDGNTPLRYCACDLEAGKL